jgi:hypothetical protein
MYVADASHMRGTPAALHDRSKYQAHAGHPHPGHEILPASTETYGHCGMPIVRYFVP